MSRNKKLPYKNTLKIKDLTETQKAYIAGLIDGEGCIALLKINRNRKELTTTYALKLVINMTHRPTMEWIKNTIGGKIHLNRNNFENHKPSYSWACNGIQADLVIKKVFSFLITKKEQAKIAIEFAETLFQRTKFAGKLKPEIIARREELRKNITILNKRGTKC